MSLKALVRPARQKPLGALVLIHGRGADEDDLIGLGELLDQERRLVLATPRAPLPLGPGAQWYELLRIGEPDPPTFHRGRKRLREWLDDFLAEQGLGLDQTFLGGFSQGAVMSYTLSLDPQYGRPRALLAFSGYIPKAPDYQADVSKAQGLPVMIQHGRGDGIIDVSFGRDAHEGLKGAGADVTYLEYPGGHTIDPDGIKEAQTWLLDRLPAGES